MFTFVCLLIFWITWSDPKNLKEPGRSWTEPDPAPIDPPVLRSPVHPRTLILAPGLKHNLPATLRTLHTKHTIVFSMTLWSVLLLSLIFTTNSTASFIGKAVARFHRFGSRVLFFLEDTHNSAIPNIVRLALASGDEYRGSPVSRFVITASP